MIIAMNFHKSGGTLGKKTTDKMSNFTTACNMQHTLWSSAKHLTEFVSPIYIYIYSLKYTGKIFS